MPKIEFRPDPDGFAFSNSWTFDPTERAVLVGAINAAALPAAIALGPIGLGGLIALNVALANSLPDQVYGLCGGMAAASRDYIQRRWVVPRGSGSGNQPQRVVAGGTPESEQLRAYIWERLMATLGVSAGAFVGWELMLKVVPESWPFSGGAPRLKEWSQDEYARIRDRINHGQPVVVGLVGETWIPTNNHQVLAYGYEDFGGGRACLWLYDNNKPDQEIRLDVDFTGSALRATHSGYATGFHPAQGPIRGFFCVDVGDRQPPAAIGISAGISASTAGPVRIDDTASFSFTARNAGFSSKPPVRLWVDGRPLANPSENVDPGGEGAAFDLPARGGTRALNQGHRFRGAQGAQRFTARARLQRRPEADWVTRSLPPMAPGTRESVDIVVAPPANWSPMGGILITPPAVGRNPDGRLEVFGLGTDSILWHIWQTAPSNGWSGWASMGGPRMAGKPIVLLNGSRQLEVFLRGADNTIQHVWLGGGGWSGFAGLGGISTSDPTVALNPDGRSEAFTRGTDNALWRKWQQVGPGGPWYPYFGNWEATGAPAGGVGSHPVAARNADGRLEVFARGGDQRLWSRWQTSPGGGWSSGWGQIGTTTITGNIGVGANGDGRLEVFARGLDGTLNHVWQTAPSNGWSGWASRGGPQLRDGARPAVIRNERTNRLHVFALGADSRVWHVAQAATGGWGSWQDLGGPLSSEPAVGQNPDGRLEVFALGTDRSLYHRWEVAPGGGWS